MTSYLLLTAVGADRTGLVDEVSEHLAERQLNIETSRMALLGGEFAMILLVSGAEADVEALEAECAQLAASTGLQVFARRTQSPGEHPIAASVPYRVVTAGMDHRGIVHEIARLLHRFQVSVGAMDTQVVRAPVSGTPVFNMEATVYVPVGVKIRELREALDGLGDELNMDIELSPREGP